MFSGCGEIQQIEERNKIAVCRKKAMFIEHITVAKLAGR